MNKPFLSICIPSFNRPLQLSNLIASIDCNAAKVEIVICEDLSPKRAEVRAAVAAVTLTSPYKIRYYENTHNLGFDGNLRRLVEYALGEYILFMGDDDLFVAGSLDPFIGFLNQHRDKPYILRSYLTEHPDGRKEYFRYLPETRVLPKGESTVRWLFKRSVTICGFTISRDEALRFATSDLDGTLLYQVYLMAQVCLESPSVYYGIPIVNAVQSFRGDQAMFGNAETEKKRFTPGMVSQDNSINFTKAYFEVAAYLDIQHGTHLEQSIRVELSKYSYPFLSIQRKRGIPSFLNYTKRLESELALGITPYYHAYKWALVLFGEANCDRLIRFIKARLGYTPNF